MKNFVHVQLYTSAGSTTVLIRTLESTSVVKLPDYFSKRIEFARIAYIPFTADSSNGEATYALLLHYTTLTALPPP